MKGYCGQELKTKVWKQGTSIFCNKIGHGQVSYPNNGLGEHLHNFCYPCKHNGEEVK